MAAEPAGKPCAGRFWEGDDSTGVWVPCKGNGATYCTNREAKTTVRVRNQQIKDGAKFASMSFQKATKIWTCAGCSNIVIRAHVQPLLEAASSKSSMEEANFIDDVLKITGTKNTTRCKKRPNHDSSTPEGFFNEPGTDDEEEEEEWQQQEAQPDDATDAPAPPVRRRSLRRVTLAKPEPPVTEDPLDLLWPAARPLIPRFCFVYSIIVTICRVLLIQNGVETLGRSAGG